MGFGDRRYDTSGNVEKAEVAGGALGAIALAVVKAGRAEEVSGFLKRHMTGIDATTPAGELALKCYEEAMNAIALHARRLNPTGGKDRKAEDDP